jgi:hypothetical protein
LIEVVQSSLNIPAELFFTEKERNIVLCDEFVALKGLGLEIEFEYIGKNKEFKV